MQFEVCILASTVIVFRSRLFSSDLHQAGLIKMKLKWKSRPIKRVVMLLCITGCFPAVVFVAGGFNELLANSFDDSITQFVSCLANQRWSWHNFFSFGKTRGSWADKIILCSFRTIKRADGRFGVFSLSFSLEIFRGFENDKNVSVGKSLKCLKFCSIPSFCASDLFSRYFFKLRLRKVSKIKKRLIFILNELSRKFPNATAGR